MSDDPGGDPGPENKVYGVYPFPVQCSLLCGECWMGGFLDCLNRSCLFWFCIILW
ncbi:hypothetical protein [Methanospirillum hungatei]|uniref:hypothetical protein n=1 Tax=Methanospirillum hungatei TaxID=2203 RepID=UPI000324EFCE|nr:hypothetical protein [Methanospirillum hungatei]